MRTHILFLLPLSFLFLSMTSSLAAPSSQDSVQGPEGPLEVGVKSAPPFLIEGKDGRIDKGVAHDLWVKIAENREWEHRLVHFDTLNKLLHALEKERIDLSISPVTVTSDRVERMDFTHSFYISNLAIAVQKQTKDRILRFLQNFFSLDFFRSVFLLFLVVLTFGTLLWVFEKRENPEMFRKGWRGVMDGFWWSAVTMTTVGYGDKAPKSGWGKFIATIWMFTAVIIVSGFTATIASSLTVQRTQDGMEDLQDLARSSTHTVEGSNSAEFLRKRGIDPITQPTLEDAIEALEKGRADAVFYDEPLLRYMIHEKGYQNDITVLNRKFEEQHYSFGLPEDSPYEEGLNQELLKVLESQDWERILQRYDL
jgi:polar amino acid transport system substrate-binding protein